MASTDKILTKTCLNCGSTNVEEYCANCGQKAQATKQPFRVFLTDAVETLFNIDSRIFKTLKDLFRYPGKLTNEYVAGKRATYLPPLRIYISISVIYFLLAQLINTDTILFVDFTLDEESADLNLAKVIQTAMFFLVPVMAGFIALLQRKRKAFYVEYLIFSMHIHSIWFVLFTIELLFSYLIEFFFSGSSNSIVTVISVAVETFQLFAMIYLVLSMKKVYQQKWFITIIKSFTVLFLYLTSLALVTFLAFIVF